MQRWDWQQKHTWQDSKGKHGGRGKRKQRNQPDLHEGGSRSSAKRRKFDAPEELDRPDDVGPSGNTDSFGNASTPCEDNSALPAEIIADSQVADAEDLPRLPLDVSNLPLLRPGQAKAGMVITWKQWLLSAATGWQPQLSSLTAAVVDTENDGIELRVRLAQRDRKLDRTEKRFDEATGERIYDRFEGPDLEDDDGDEDDLADDGLRDIQFHDLVEPRVVQPPSPRLLNPRSADDGGGTQATAVSDSQERSQSRLGRSSDGVDGGSADAVLEEAPSSLWKGKGPEEPQKLDALRSGESKARNEGKSASFSTQPPFATQPAQIVGGYGCLALGRSRRWTQLDKYLRAKPR